jgi:hypothetical protein
MFLVLKHYVPTQAKLNARIVTISESLSIRRITILVGFFNIISRFLQHKGNQRESEVGSTDGFEWIWIKKSKVISVTAKLEMTSLNSQNRNFLRTTIS